MSISVHELVKYYGPQKALDAVSFEAVPGRILGFLGPNGAGKSTTMKIITGFLPQNSGKVKVCGADIETEDMRRRIGYLPELNPLYSDQYVKEALGFTADVYGLQDKKNRIARVIEQTGLGPEQHKKIGQLSRGYRQRVGLAQAILHDPDVLILDEPTSGLDPNQVIGIRELIRELGQRKTVIFSTHIMQEADAVCDAIVIIDKGRIVADDSLKGIKEKHKGKSLEDIFRTLTRGKA